MRGELAHLGVLKVPVCQGCDNLKMGQQPLLTVLCHLQRMLVIVQELVKGGFCDGLPIHSDSLPQATHMWAAHNIIQGLSLLHLTCIWP